MEALDEALTEAGVTNSDLRTLANSDLPIAPFADQILQQRQRYNSELESRRQAARA